MAHCLNECPALLYEESAPLSYLLSDSHFVPLALFFFLTNLNFKITLHSQSLTGKLILWKPMKKMGFPFRL